MPARPLFYAPCGGLSDGSWKGKTNFLLQHRRGFYLAPMLQMDRMVSAQCVFAGILLVLLLKILTVVADIPQGLVQV